MTIGDLGFKRARDIIERELADVPAPVRAKMRRPETIDDLMPLMWDIEHYSISLHDHICRVLEEEWRGPPKRMSEPESNFIDYDD